MTNPQTWPGTGIHKSQANAFNWRGAPSQIFARHPNEFKHGTHSANGVKERATTDFKASPMQSAMADLRKSRHGGAYSRAAAKGE